jgi:hypothetical protein
MVEPMGVDDGRYIRGSYNIAESSRSLVRGYNDITRADKVELYTHKRDTVISGRYTASALTI